MSEPTVTSAPAPPQADRRKLLHVAGALALVGAVGVLALLALHKKAPAPGAQPPGATDERLRAAVAEADRLDPRWRFAELEADRAKVPDADNAAPLVLASYILMPKELNGLNS